MESIVKVIEGEEFEFRQEVNCFRCGGLIKPDDERTTVGVITGHVIGDPKKIFLAYNNYCNDCGKEIKKAINPLDQGYHGKRNKDKR